MLSIDAYTAAIDAAEEVLESAIEAETRGDRGAAQGQAFVARAALLVLRHAIVEQTPVVDALRLLVDGLLTEATALVTFPHSTR